MIQTLLNAFYFIVTLLFLVGTFQLVGLLKDVLDVLIDIRDFLAELKRDDP